MISCCGKQTTKQLITVKTVVHLSLLNTGVSDLHNCMCACCIQGLWIIVELTLALVLAQSSWINYGVLGQKPLYWTVDIPLPTAFVTIPGMLV